jgi:hypothetical protein
VTIALRVGSYDSEHALVIDPVLGYANRIGGSAQDITHDVAVDASGNIHLAGQTASATFPGPSTTIGTRASDDVVVLKLAPDGATVIYSTFIGSTGSDAASAIAIDTDGTAAIVGRVGAYADFPTTVGACDRIGGPASFFVAKLSAAGSSLLYSTMIFASGGPLVRGVGVGPCPDGQRCIFVSGEGFAGPFGVAAGKRADAYLAGRTDSTSGFSPSPGPGGVDAFLARGDTVIGLPLGTVGVASSESLPAYFGAAPYSWTLVSGTVPAGLTLDSDGTLHGTPTAVGTATFSTTVSDASSVSATLTYRKRIGP